jgi:putative thioredoxin
MRSISQAEFDAEVVEASRTRPVVVDFWAPWCGPCHQLSPMLEQAAEAHAGEVDAVKLNIDEAPEVARRYRIQGIPAVKAFKDGKVVGEFVGVQPLQVVERLFAGLAPTQTDRLVAEAEATTDPAEAEHLLREALAADRDHAGGTLALARLLVARAERAEALALLDRLPSDPQARRMAAELRLGGQAANGDLDALRREAATGSPQAMLRLGQALAAAGDHAEALPALIGAVRDADTREEARQTVLEVFAVLGDDSEAVRVWRPRLAAALF